MNHPRDWFTPNGDGLGWMPKTREGWAVIAAVLVGSFVISRFT